MKYKSELNNITKIESIQEMVLYTTKKYSDKIALQDLANTPINKVSYRELFEYILKFGNLLKNLGIPERTHIAVIGENRVQWAITYLTAMCFNYVIVPIDKNLTPNEIINIIHESDTQVVVFSEQFVSMFEEYSVSLKRITNYICMDNNTNNKKFLVMSDLINKNQDDYNIVLPSINKDEIAALLFTSGSLGRAKGVMLSQNNIASNLVDMLSMLMIYPNDKFLSVLPMHHTYECTCGMLCPLFSGASIHFARSLKTVTDDIKNVKATVLLGVPLLYDKIFKRISKTIEDDKVKSVLVPFLRKITNITSLLGIKELKKLAFKTLHEKFGGNIRLFIAGGAAVDPLVARGLREFGFVFLQGYGLTETSPILALNRIDQFKDNSAGLALPRVELKINKPDEFGVGEVFVKAPNVMLGYYKNELATSEAYEDGWFKTGDLARIDEEGFVYISGRAKNVIISNSGKNVYPEELEDLLNRSEYILESVVYGEKDDKHDEVISAKIVVDAESIIVYSETNNIKITNDLLNEIISDEIQKINKQLASFKHIKRFYIQEHEFEKTTTQKIKRYLVNK